MKNKNGFTLVEMVIAIAVASLIIMFLAEMITQSIRAYNISLENNEGLTKIVPVLKRIENDLYESYGSITAVSEINATSFAGITIQGDFGTHSYFWDRSGDGLMNTVELEGIPDIARSFYRTSGGGIDVLLSSNGKIPASLTAKYGENWNKSYIKIKEIYFSFYREEPAGSGKSVIWDNTRAAAEINYVRIHVSIEGAYEHSAYNFDTGLKIK